MWRLKSFTFWFNVFLLLTGTLIFSEKISQIVIPIAIANIGLREKTQRKIK